MLRRGQLHHLVLIIEVHARIASRMYSHKRRMCLHEFRILRMSKWCERVCVSTYLSEHAWFDPD